jgi:MFS family permease
VTWIALYPPILYFAAFIVSFRVPSLLQRLGGMGLALCCLAAGCVGLLALLPDSIALSAVAPLSLGLGYGAMTPASSHILGPRTSLNTAGLVMSIKQSGVPLGAVLAGAILPIFILHLGWQYALIALTLATGAVALVLLPSVAWLSGTEGAAKPVSYRPLEPVRRLFKVRGMMTLLFATLVFTAMQLCLRSFFTVYLVKDLGLNLATAGLAFGVSQAVGIFGQVGWATVSDRLLSPHTVMAIVGSLMTIAAVLTAVIGPGSSVFVVIGVAALFGISAAGFIPVVLGEVARHSPSGQVGAMTSGANLFVISGALLGPLVFGAVSSGLGYPAAFIALALCTLVGTVAVASRSGA